MVKNYFALYHLTLELKETFESGYIFESYSQRKNELSVTIAKNKTMWSLILTSAHPKLGLYFTPYSPKQRQDTAKMFKQANDLKVVSIEISDCERLITFVLENNFAMVFQLYSADTNCFLLQDGVIVEAFKHKHRYLKQSLIEKNTTPVIKNLERLVLEDGYFSEAYKHCDGNHETEILKALLPGFDLKLQRHILTRLNRHVSENDPEKALYEVLQDIYYELIDPIPKIYFSGDEALAFSIISHETAANERYETFESINEAIKQFSRYIYFQESVGKTIRQLQKQVAKLLEKKQRQVQDMRSGLERDRSVQYEEMGQLILANAHRIEKGQASISVSSWTDQSNEREVLIPLKPAKTPYENADNYFKKAKKERQNRDVLKQRLNDSENDLVTLNAMQNSLALVKHSKAFKVWKSEWLEAMKAHGLIPKQDMQEHQQIRKFKLSDKAEVWVGKNAKSNQLLTFKLARPNDTWLHARGVSGSHCIIKAHGICSKADLEHAAEIAAFHSAAKTSDMVPVMITQKKYVRRKKGAPPGMVAVEREEVLMVKPRPFPENDGYGL